MVGCSVVCHAERSEASARDFVVIPILSVVPVLPKLCGLHLCNPQERNYLTPDFEVVEIAVERGFEVSQVDASGFGLTDAVYTEEDVW